MVLQDQWVGWKQTLCEGFALRRFVSAASNPSTNPYEAGGYT